jgi:hypothetical protein
MNFEAMFFPVRSRNKLYIIFLKDSGQKDKAVMEQGAGLVPHPPMKVEKI